MCIIDKMHYLVDLKPTNTTYFHHPKSNFFTNFQKNQKKVIPLQKRDDPTDGFTWILYVVCEITK